MRASNSSADKEKSEGLGDLASVVGDPELEPGPSTRVKRQRKRNPLIVLGAIAMFSVFVIWYISQGTPANKVAPIKEEEKPLERSKTDPTANVTLNDQMVEVEKEYDRDVTQTEPAPEPDAAAQPAGEKDGEAPPTPSERRRLGEVMVSFEVAEKEGEAKAEEGKLGDSVTARATPTGNRDFLMTKGTVIKCALETRIVTEHPGFVRCVVTKDVYSANGRTVLLDRGTAILGEQTSALVKGQARVFALWTEAITPNGTRVKLDSPAAGALGEAGAPAVVDRHLAERFGGAILLTMIEKGASNFSIKIGKGQKSPNQSGVTVNNFSKGEASTSPSEMAAEALRDGIDIPPTGIVKQGTLLTIISARDLDFSEAYGLRFGGWK